MYVFEASQNQQPGALGRRMELAHCMRQRQARRIELAHCMRQRQARRMELAHCMRQRQAISGVNLLMWS